MTTTTPRAIRVPEELWQAALDKTQTEGTTVTAVVLAALREYLEQSDDLRDARAEAIRAGTVRNGYTREVVTR